jgi:hypothetical protein
MRITGYVASEANGTVAIEFTDGAERVAVEMSVEEAARLGARLQTMAENRQAARRANAAMPASITPLATAERSHLRALAQEGWYGVAHYPELAIVNQHDVVIGYASGHTWAVLAELGYIAQNETYQNCWHITAAGRDAAGPDEF